MASERDLHAKEKRRPGLSRTGESVDYPFLLLVLLLLTVGLAMLYSASYAQSEYDTSYEISTKYLQKQAVCAAIGLAAMFFFSRIPTGVWYRFAWPLYGVSIALLLSVLVIGEEVNGARRWINLAGIQFQPFNSIYQLYADKKVGRLAEAEDFLMIPEYLLWKLCGVKAREYTNATSTGLVNAQTGEYDPEILKALGLPEAMFPKLTAPGTVLGSLTPNIAAEVGGQTNVVLCATHDTASAVEGIPMEQGEAPFLSSGTWSLLGVKLAQPVTTPESCKANFTNEGGVGYIRYLKNIMGLWIIQCVQKQLGISFAEMVELAKASTYTRIFDVNAARFSAPQDMRAEIRAALAETGEAPATDADLINSIYHSLAYCYGEAYREMEAVTGQHWDKLYIAGGGAKNATLNELTAHYTGKQVVALPIEATAIGNLKIQMSISEGGTV